jgi:hypothetical protein
MTRTLVLYALCASPILINPASATTYFVAADGSGDFATIQAAVDAADPGDIIELGDGTFMGNGNRDVDCSGTELIIRSQSGTPVLCIIDCQGSWESHHRGFLLGSERAPEPQLLGVTIRNGDVRTDDPLLGGGGATYCGAGSPRIENCIFENNLAQRGGAVIFTNSLSPQIIGCRFTGNQANYHGGGLHGTYASGSTVTDCDFADNSAALGGGLYISSTTMSACTITGNTATERGGGAFLSDADLSGCTFEGNHATSGGAVSIEASAEDVVLEDCEFLDNSADEGGGALDYRGDVLPTNDVLAGCLFVGNQAISGGAASTMGISCPLFDGCTFLTNEATYGGAVNLGWSYDPHLAGCTFAENAADWGGALLAGTQGTLTLSGSTFYGNAGRIEGGAVYLVLEGGGSCDIQNTIVASSSEGAALATDGMGEITMGCCDLYGNAGGDWIGVIAGLLGVDGNITLDPQFCDAPGGDFGLAETSPCAPFSPPNPECDLIGAQPITCVATPVVTTSWGGIKELFRR